MPLSGLIAQWGELNIARWIRQRRPFLALSNQSLLEMRHTDVHALKIPAVVQERSQLYVQGCDNTATWQKDTTSRITTKYVQ